MVSGKCLPFMVTEECILTCPALLQCRQGRASVGFLEHALQLWKLLEGILSLHILQSLISAHAPLHQVGLTGIVMAIRNLTTLFSKRQVRVFSSTVIISKHTARY